MLVNEESAHPRSLLTFSESLGSSAVTTSLHSKGKDTEVSCLLKKILFSVEDGLFLLFGFLFVKR